MTVADDTLVLSAPANLRDLAGIPIPGGAVRPGFAIRADDLSTADAESIDRLVAGGLAAVIDLRSHDEAQATGRGPLGAADVSYHHIPFLATIARAVDPRELTAQSRFGAMYVRMVEGAAPRIVQALGVIAHAPGAVAFHCAAGQDRTGVLAASLLLALGARAEDIVADYAETGRNSAAIMERLTPLMGPLMSRLGVDLDEAARAATRAAFSPAPMRELLAHLGAYPDPLEPLRRAGLTDVLIARLRERALG